MYNLELERKIIKILSKMIQQCSEERKKMSHDKKNKRCLKKRKYKQFSLFDFFEEAVNDNTLKEES